jgi:hypothetical protein
MTMVAAEQSRQGKIPVKIVIDSTTDLLRSAWVALVVAHGEKPRLMYGTGWHISHRSVERWGLARALKRVNSRYNGSAPILVFTDSLAIVETGGNRHTQYRWLAREQTLMRHIHTAARKLRQSMPAACPCCRQDKEQATQILIPESLSE